ncbi:hypothetical protein SDRG_02365 [Saprolegnia diclina VS20]|uniref:DNA alkylation repair enzyme n=1 Tax=Saprolegnia diclina (strain VS20) TaxID=1156394 RepID=T0SCG0_SAPDV|nr:hypothetical protein SDRG_02365 [Saprolegnia diclina VS20]EQC40472.1 hypothetical protein SDRG_02365 [Saprolegnia diclina VS20]|eukprot:XP_008606171.1 hypothetical protein SDRG_02365 [Saprolegnia diclina VS20]
MAQRKASATTLLQALEQLQSPAFAKKVERFFRRSYCPTDVFVGLRVPQCRDALKKYLATTSKTELLELLRDPRHEMRLTALIALTEVYERPSKAPLWQPVPSHDDVRLEIRRVLLAHAAFCNNWDLVDTCCHKILGHSLLHFEMTAVDAFLSRPDDITLLPDWYTALLTSSDLWETRMSIVALLGVRADNVALSYAICAYHLRRFHDAPALRCTLNGVAFESLDLIHKALGWVLRENGKEGKAQLETFLDEFAPKASKTTVRYATEHLPKAKVKRYVAMAT